MSRKSDPIEIKVKRCLDSIENLHSVLYKKLYTELQDNILATSVSKLRKYLVEYLKIPTTGRHTRNYWISRGWSEAEALVKIKINNKNRIFISPYSREFWTNKVNPVTGVNYTTDEADLERNSRRPTKKEYWLKMGYSLEDSLKLAEKTRKDNTQLGVKNSKKISPELRRASSPLNIDYWIFRGFTEEESIEKISERQRTFSLKLCIEKYGEEQGEKVWKERQLKWQTTLLNKTDEEIFKINLKKNPHRIDCYTSIDELIDSLAKKNIKIYKTEDELIEKVLKDLNENIIKTYWKPEKYVNKLPKIQFEVLGISKDYFVEKIKDKFNTGAVLLENSGCYKNYIMWVDEGLLRSSFEIYFYQQIKKIDSSAIISVDESYPNSRMRFDFFIKNGDYIEICPIKIKTSNHSKKIEYDKTINKKIKLFNPILLSTIQEIDDYIEKYKNEFIG